MSHSSHLAGSAVLCSAAESAWARPRRPLALLVAVEPALGALVAEWLDEIGVDVVAGVGAKDDGRGVDLVVVDVPYPRQEGAARLRRLSDALPAVPILALSPTFCAGVAPSGTVARELGVAGVLASPVHREALVAAVRGLLERMP